MRFWKVVGRKISLTPSFPLVTSLVCWFPFCEQVGESCCLLPDVLLGSLGCAFSPMGCGIPQFSMNWCFSCSVPGMENLSIIFISLLFTAERVISSSETQVASAPTGLRGATEARARQAWLMEVTYNFSSDDSVQQHCCLTAAVTWTGF